MDPVSCVSCVSLMYRANATETYETFHQESGMRYHYTDYIWWYARGTKSGPLTLRAGLSGAADPSARGFERAIPIVAPGSRSDILTSS